MCFNELQFNKKKTFVYVQNSTDHVAKKTSIYKVESKWNYTWLEWDYATTFSSIKFENTKVAGYLQSPLKILNCLTIKYMDIRCGSGMFTRQKIYEDDVVGIFTGKHFKCKTKKYDKMNLHSAFAYSISDDETMVTDGSLNGNVTRFVQDLPTKEELNDYQFDDSVKIQNIATENLAAEIFPFNDLQILYFFASRNINIGEIMGCAYGKEWWNNHPKITRLFFFKNGDVIEPDLVKKKKVELNNL